MASLRQIRSRIRSVQNSKQIMRAMQLVSGSKLKRAQDRLVQVRSVMQFLDALLERVLIAQASGSSAKKPLTHPLCQVRPSGPSALVVFTSDAGLCGSYNTNLVHLAESHLRRDAAAETQLIFVGRRGYRYITKRGYHATEAYIDLAGRPNAAKVEVIGQSIVDRFLSGQVSSVSVLYSKFVSALVYQPVVQQFLPISLAGRQEAAGQRSERPADPRDTDYIFEPSAEKVFADLLPRWALIKFRLILLEAFTSEHSARMIAMRNATDNAQELLDALTTQRNRIRQAAITKELSEIVGTAEALK